MSIIPASNCDWNTENKSDLIGIGTHKLWLSAHGVIRQEGDPLVIILPGLASSTTGWAAVRRDLSTFVRVLQYERSGYGASDASLLKPTAMNIAYELDLLLKYANIDPPFVIVAHSWGGIISREFLALRTDDIHGMIFVDANQERTLEVLDWRKLAMSDVLAGVNANEATGLLQSHHLTSEEWAIYQNEENSEKHQKQATLEFAEYPHTFSPLATKRQLCRSLPLLGSRPLCVIKGDSKSDFEKLLRAGLAHGNGNEASIAAFRETLDSWDEKDQSLQLETQTLSSVSKYVEIRGSGHNVHLTSPHAIVDGVRWVLEHS